MAFDAALAWWDNDKLSFDLDLSKSIALGWIPHLTDDDGVTMPCPRLMGDGEFIGDFPLLANILCGISVPGGVGGS